MLLLRHFESILTIIWALILWMFDENVILPLFEAKWLNFRILINLFVNFDSKAFKTTIDSWNSILERNFLAYSEVLMHKMPSNFWLVQCYRVNWIPFSRRQCTMVSLNKEGMTKLFWQVVIYDSLIFFYQSQKITFAHNFV